MVETLIKGSMKSPCLPSRSPQPQLKKNLVAFCGLLDGLLGLRSAGCFFILGRCGRGIAIGVCVEGRKLAVAKD